MTCICTNGQLRVILSEAETIKYNIDLVFFECGSKKADKALTRILKMAADQIGFRSNAVRFTIEIYPVFEGGCEIFFIPDGEASKRRIPAVIKQKKRGVLQLEFNSCESMLSTIEVLYLNDVCLYVQSSLYEKDGRYRLLLDGVLRRELGLPYEYSHTKCISAVERAKTVEYWNTICDKKAIERLGCKLCKGKGAD